MCRPTPYLVPIEVEELDDVEDGQAYKAGYVGELPVEVHCRVRAVKACYVDLVQLPCGVTY